MLGSCRLFADDRSVGERSLEINNLRSMVNTDLNTITHWAKQWLVKLNPEQTNIVYFRNRPSTVDLYYTTDNIKTKPADAHTHTGVTLSADGISFRQTTVLRKIKFKVYRNFF